MLTALIVVTAISIILTLLPEIKACIKSGVAELRNKRGKK